MASKRKGDEEVPKQQQKRFKKTEQKFRKEYTAKYPCIISSAVGDHHGHCTVCRLDFKVAHGGLNDVERHVSSAKHKEICAAATPSISNFLHSDGDSQRLSVTRAEALFSFFLAEHNIPLSAADHAGALFRKMFPDSGIAKQYAAARTKTTAIVKCLAKQHTASVEEQLRNGPFILGTDGSQEGEDKFFPLVVRFINSNSEIKTELLANPVCQDCATGANIFNLIETALCKADIPWSNCLSLVCDNAHVMTGKNKGVISFVKNKVPGVHMAGCICHLLSLTCKKAIKAFEKSTGFDFDDMLRQLSWYTSKSGNRQHRLRACQVECGLPQLKLVEHCPTRWLSLGLAIQRLLQMWDPLKKFFTDECKPDGKPSCSEEGRDAVNPDTIKMRVKKFLERRTAKLYCLFLSFSIELFDKLNKEFQTDRAKIHSIKRSLDGLYRKLVVCFLKPSAVNSGSILDVDFTRTYNIKATKDIMVGSAVREYLDTCKVNEKTKEQFFKDVVAFYQAACTYLKSNVLQTGLPVWRHAEVADLSLKDSASFSSISYFLKRFPCLLPKGSTIDDLEMEFQDYLAFPIPQHISELNTVEEQWAQLGKIKDSNGSDRFRVLPRVILGILLIPVSNASCERIFSLIRKNRTDFRSSLAPETTEALIVLKCKGGSCHEQQPSDTVLRKCKSATAEYLNCDK